MKIKQIKTLIITTCVLLILLISCFFLYKNQVNNDGSIVITYTNENSVLENKILFSTDFEKSSPKTLLSLKHSIENVGFPARLFSTYKNNLYYIKNEKELNFYDIKNNRTEVVDLRLSNNEYLNDYYITEDKIIFMHSNTFCNEYRADCENIKISEYDINTKSIKLIYELGGKTDNWNIYGIDYDNFVFNYGSGDAGFSYQNFITININTREVVSKNYFSFDSNEDSSQKIAEEQKNLEIYKNNLQKNKISNWSYANTLTIKNGSLLESNTDETLKEILEKETGVYTSLENIRIFN